MDPVARGEQYQDYYDEESQIFYDFYTDLDYPEYEAGAFSVDKLPAVELWNQCLWPTSSGPVLQLFLKYLTCCFAMRCVISVGAIPRPVCSIISATLGSYLVLTQLDRHCFYCLCTLALTTVILILFHQYGWSAKSESLTRNGAVFAVAYIIVCHFFLDPMLFTKVRGPLMILTMKMISLCHDASISLSKRSEDGAPGANVLQVLNSCAWYLGYSLDCATVLFGCWISFDDYKWLLQKKPVRASIHAIVLGILCLAVSFACLLYSACIAEWLIPQALVDMNRWVWCYREAHTYRFSHYFTCFFGQGGILLVGWDLAFKPSTVCRLIDLELPRSLVQIVINWNVPIHAFLKIYVFRPLRTFGAFWAIAGTYLASSMLHGFNVQMSLTLLSLGFYTYAEFGCRKRLAAIFDSCVESRPCRTDCGHKHKSGTLRAFALNLLLGVVALLQYSYLGMLFNASTEAEVGYSAWHAYNMWSRMAFSGHIVGLAMFLGSRVI